MQVKLVRHSVIVGIKNLSPHTRPINTYYMRNAPLLSILNYGRRQQTEYTYTPDNVNDEHGDILPP